MTAFWVNVSLSIFSQLSKLRIFKMTKFYEHFHNCKSNFMACLDKQAKRF